MTWGAIGAAGIGAAGALAGGMMGANSANQASSAMTKASNRAAALQQQNYMQTRQDQMPYRYIGNQALNVLAMTYGLDPYSGQTAAPPAQIPTNLTKKQKKALAKVTKALGYNPLTATPTTAASGGSYNVVNPLATGGKGAVGSPSTYPVYTDPRAPAPGQGTYNYFMASPDYQFRQKEGINALDRSAAARGMLLSGAQARGVTDYASNLAAGEYGNWFNRMANIAGIGQTATNQVNVAGQNAATASGNYMSDAGMARASGYLGEANSWANAIQGIGSAAADAWEAWRNRK